jgi:hypothetical protein
MSARFVFLSLVLAGCASVQPLINPVDAVVGEAITTARAPAAEQAAALARAEKQARSAGTNPLDWLRLATFLATLPPPLRDDARALELLGPLADAASPGVGRFAALLSSQIVERQRIARELDHFAREARERDRLDKERDRLDKERDKREEALKQQLEALRAIERGILEREEKLRRRQK